MNRGVVLLLSGVLLILIGLAYAPVLSGGFVFDDVPLVQDNAALWDGWGFDLRIWNAPGDGTGDEKSAARINFRPVRFLSYRLDALATRWWYGEDVIRPEFFHLHNILLHALNTVLVALLVRRLAPEASVYLAFGAALCFGLHPVHAESVAYISGRRDVLFLSFYLLAILVYAVRRDRAGWGTGGTVAGLFLLALASKEMAVTLPVTLLGVEAVMARRWSSFRWRGSVLIPVAVIGLLYISIWFVFQNPGRGAEPWGGSRWTALWTSARGTFAYLGLLAWPDPLTVDYSYAAFRPSSGPFEPATGLLGGLGLLGLLGVAGLAARRGRVTLAVGIPLFFVLLAPVAQIVPHPERFAERFLYLPSLALLLVVAGTVPSSWWRQGLPVGGALTVVLLAFTVRLESRLEDSSGPYPLWRSAVQVAPDCARAQVAYGDAAADLGYVGEAVRAFGRAIEVLEPVTRDALQQGYYLRARALRGSLLLTSTVASDWELARSDYETLLPLTDTDGTPVAEDVEILLGSMMANERLGASERAAKLARAVLALDPPPSARTRAWLQIVQDLAASNDVRGALRALDEWQTQATSSREQGRVHYARGELFKREKTWAKARTEFQAAARDYEGKGGWVSARYQVGECLREEGDLDQARLVFSELSQREPPHVPSILQWAEIARSSGDLEKAKELYRLLLSVSPDHTLAQQGIASIEMKQRLEAAGQTAPPTEPPRATVLLRLARKLVAEGKPDRALRALEEAEKHAEGPDQRENRLEIRLTRARLLVDAERLPEAKAAYESFLEKADRKERAAAVVEYSTLLRRTDGAARAYEALTAEETRGVEYPGLYKKLGDLGVACGKRREAARWYRLHLSGEVSDEEREILQGVIELLESSG